MFKIKDKLAISWKITIGVVYGFLMLPMIFSMYNSVPAADDFAFGSNTISDNDVVDAWGYSVWNWLYHSGRWLTFFFQKLINPLNTNAHLGRVYGVWMICVFALVFILIHYSLKVILKRVVDTSKINIEIPIMLVFVILFSTYYYVETYNWYIGATAYAIPFALLMLTMAWLIRYEETTEKKYYYGMIVAGLLPATNEFLDVPIGLLYIYIVLFVFKKDIKDYKTIINRLIPLLIFIICGISVVVAPGNFARQNVYEVTPSLSTSVKQILIDMVVRGKDICINHPLAIIILGLLLMVGVSFGREFTFKSILGVAIVTFFVAFGAVFPYIYGRAMTTTYMDVRMFYVFDYILLIGASVFTLLCGSVISNKVKAAVVNGIVVCGILLVAAVLMLLRGGYRNIVQVGIISNANLIKYSYDFWDGIILEIEESNEADVVIYREEEPTWTPYFLYMGLVPDYKFAVEKGVVYDKEFIMPNIYYGKDSIEIVYTKGLEDE